MMAASNEMKVALITGASRRLGKQLALACAQHGLAVVVDYAASEDAAREVVAEITALGDAADQPTSSWQTPMRPSSTLPRTAVPSR